MPKKRWVKPLLKVLVRQHPDDNVNVLQGCKFTALQGPAFANCESGPQGGQCAGIIAS